MKSLTVETNVQFGRRGKGARKVLEPKRESATEQPVGRLPRITRLMALALKFEQMLQDGVVDDYAELARLGNVTRARISQIMNLTLLAPDIQEAILNLPRVTEGDDSVHLRMMQEVALEADWRKQRRMWDN